MSLDNIDSLIRALNSSKLDVHATIKDIKREMALKNQLDSYISLCKDLKTHLDNRTKVHFELSRKLQELSQIKTAPDMKDAAFIEPHQIARYQESFKRIQQETNLLINRLKIGNLL